VAGDYILSCVDRTPKSVRWEYRFAKLQGLACLSLLAVPERGRLAITARFEGTARGPQWLGVADGAMQREFVLHRDRNVPQASFAEEKWPATVAVFPLSRPVGPSKPEVTQPPVAGLPFVISPKPTLEELAKMELFADSSSSSCKVTEVSPESAVICVGKPVTFTAKGTDLDDVTWDTGGEGIPATGKGATFVPHFNNPGTYTVTASCNGSSASATVTAATISFSTNKVVTGLTKPLPNHLCDIEDFTISTEVIATVDPASAVDKVSINIGGIKRVDAEIDKDSLPGKIVITLTATSMTPGNKPDGDTQLQAKLAGKVCQEIPIIVLKPYAVVPVSTPETMVNGKNEVADKCSSPAYSGALNPNQVYLWTVYGVIQNIQVNDQFGQPLNAIYDGAPVFENINGWKPINQTLSGGHYSDPVGGEPTPGPAPAKVLRSDERVEAWPNASPKPTTNQNLTQKIPVQIAGVELVTGIANRKINVEAIPGTTSANITIDWTSSPSP